MLVIIIPNHDTHPVITIVWGKEMKTEISNIHSYTLFANIDDRKGSISGHQVILGKEQYRQIEDIALSEDMRLIEDITYELTE